MYFSNFYGIYGKEKKDGMFVNVLQTSFEMNDMWQKYRKCILSQFDLKCLITLTRMIYDNVSEKNYKQMRKHFSNLALNHELYIAATCAASESYQYVLNENSGEMKIFLEYNTINIKDFKDDSRGYIERYFYTVPVETLGSESHSFNSYRSFLDEDESSALISEYNGAST